MLDTDDNEDNDNDDEEDMDAPPSTLYGASSAVDAIDADVM